MKKGTVKTAPRKATRAAESAEPASDDRDASAASREASGAAGSVEASRIVRLRGLAALEPRPVRDIGRERALRTLEEGLELVGALAERAIAVGWDSGRLSDPGATALPFAREVAGLLQRGGGLAAAEASAAHARLQALDRAHAKESESAEDTPLGELARELSLSPLACRIVMVCAAPRLWGEIARLYAIVSNDRERPLCDELLVAQILGDAAGRRAIAAELDHDAPLVRRGVLRVGEGARPFRELEVDPIVIRRLCLEPMATLDSDEDGLALVEPTRTLDEIVLPPGVLDQVLSAVESRPPRGPLRLVLRGRGASGRRTLLAALARAANRVLGVIDVQRVAREGAGFAARLRRLLHRVVLRGGLPCVAGVDSLMGEDAAVREALPAILSEHAGPLCVRCADGTPPPLPPGHRMIDLPPLDEQARHSYWSGALERHGLPVALADHFTPRYRIEAGVIEAVTRDAAALRERDATAGHPARDAGADLEAALRQHRTARIGGVATQVTRLPSFEQVVLPAETLDGVRELIGRVQHRRTVYERWGFDRVVTSARGLTALFQGTPGTGKSMMAGVIARELGFDLYRIDLSRILSKWIGETEQNLAGVFDAAEEGQAVLLFDEADSLFARRTEVKSSIDRYANVEVNYLLQRLDSFEGVAVLTTNQGGSIDPAFRRRVTLQLTFPFPDEEMREKIWRVHLPAELPVAGELDLKTIARRYQMSGGYIRNAAVRAAFLAAQEAGDGRSDGARLTHAHIERAVAIEYRQMGKLTAGGMLE